jgi:hypothetical protein
MPATSQLDRRREAQPGSCTERENLIGDAKGKGASGRYLAGGRRGPSTLALTLLDGASNADRKAFVETGLFSRDRVQGRSAHWHTSNNKPAAIALFVNFRAALEGTQHRECCSIRAIIPPVLPPGFGKFVCEI